MIIDVGALVDGYHSDMTRTFVVGEPTPEQHEVYDLVLAAQLAGLEAIAVGVAARDVDAACRDLFADAGYGDWYLHGTGHGVGLEIHEAPSLRWDGGEELVEGMVVTIEPGVYIPGLGGVRIEDMVEVTTDGRREIPRAPKELIVL